MLICGAGPVTRELLKRLGDAWEVTLLDRSEQRLAKAAAFYAGELVAQSGDPTSPVALEQADLAGQDYVLALTDTDADNHAVAQSAVDAGVPQVAALVWEADQQDSLNAMGVRTLLASAVLAREIHHFLDNPEVRVTPLTLGKGAVMEVEAKARLDLAGQRVRRLHGRDWRLVGIVRQGGLLLPQRDTVVETGDRLIFLGKPDIFGSFCGSLDCSAGHFPQSFGQDLLIALRPQPKGDYGPVLEEGLHWALNAKIASTKVICREDQCEIDYYLSQWPAASQVEVRTTRGSVMDLARAVCQESSVGLVLLNKLEPTFLKSLGKATLMNLSDSLGAPLLLAGHTMPYQRILVPFNGRPRSEAGLGVALELAEQQGSEITLGVVREPSFIRGGGESSWLESLRQRAKEVMHQHKVNLRIKELSGNPVKEISAMSSQYDLVVVGGSSEGRGLLAPNVGEQLAQKATCSVLVVTG
jgi:Trk K+ transport system NAD-binding subunit/nucleotide-binding universal stress UspA family protein